MLLSEFYYTNRDLFLAVFLYLVGCPIFRRYSKEKTNTTSDFKKNKHKAEFTACAVGENQSYVTQELSSAGLPVLKAEGAIYFSLGEILRITRNT